MAGELYALEGTGRVWKSTDGVAWFPASRLGFSDALHKPIPVEGGCLFRRRFPVEGPNDLMRYTGQELAEVVHAGVCDHTLGDDGAVYVLTTDQVLKVSGDGTSFATFVADVPDGACSIAQSDGMTYVGTMDSHIWRFG